MNKPVLICLTPVRNEAWVLNAFLKATSLWADFILIADQGSTDDSREIALRFPKVILVDNPGIEMHQAQTRQLLFNFAEKIEGDKILFALDADEFLSGDFMHSEGWNKIMNSKPGEIFWFKWINLSYPPSEYIPTDGWMYWVCHFSDEIMKGEYPDNYIHEWRFPYPKPFVLESRIDDFSFIHFARVDNLRQRNKERYYQVITKLKEPKKSIVSLYRMYHNRKIKKKYLVDESIYSFYKQNGLELLNEINISDSGAFYNQQVVKCFEEKEIFYFQGLDIWDKSFLQQYNLKDPRSIWIKIIHQYLKKSEDHSINFFVRVIDKLFIIIGV